MGSSMFARHIRKPVLLAILASIGWSMTPVAIGPAPAAATVALAAVPDRFFSETSGPEGTVWAYAIHEEVGPYVGLPVDPNYYPTTAVHVFFQVGEMWLVGPNGAALAVGTYSNAQQAWAPAAGHPGLFVGYNYGDCNAGLTGSFTILEIALGGNGLPTTLAADFEETCSGFVTHGSIRMNSDVPATGLTQNVAACCDYGLGNIAVGDEATLPVTFTNVGDTAIALGAASFTGTGAGAFHAIADTCSSASIASGASCSLTIQFAPTSLGHFAAHLVLPTDTPLGRREMSIQGMGGTPSTTTITGPDGVVFPPDHVVVTVHVAPIPTAGEYAGIAGLAIDGSGYNNAGVEADGTATFSIYSLSPGSHSFTATYTGGGAQFLLPSSTTEPFIASMGVNRSLSITSSLEPALSTQSVTITATVAGDGATPSGGQITVTDAFDGSTIASGTVGAGHQSVAVTRTFATGSHALTATYAASGIFGGSTAHLTQTIAPDLAVSASGLGVSYTTFYPYVDGYRDTEAVRGTTYEPVRVLIRIYSPTGALIKTVDLGTRNGSYATTWNGRTSSGAIRAEGKYKVVQRLTDAGNNVLTSVQYVTLSKKRLLWSTHTITQYGDQVTAKGEPGDAWVRTSSSAYSRGIRMSSGTQWAAVRWSFTLRSAVIYKPITFKTLGRSTTSKTCLQGLWNGGYGDPIDAAAYDVEPIGTAYAWYSITGSASSHQRSRHAYGEVLCENTGSGSRGFDVAKVQLTYRYAVLGY